MSNYDFRIKAIIFGVQYNAHASCTANTFYNMCSSCYLYILKENGGYAKEYITWQGRRSE